MRVRKWVAISGGVIMGTFGWHDTEGNFGRCLRVRKEELEKKCRELDGKEVQITAHYPKIMRKLVGWAFWWA